MFILSSDFYAFTKSLNEFKNNALLYTSGTAPTYPLLVDTSLYTPNAQVAQAVVSSGFRELTKYYYFGTKRVALRDVTGVYWLQGDHLGSTSLTTLSSGAVQMTSRYGAYGLVRSSSSGAVSDYRYTGQRQESLGNNWIYDYGARFYDALIGRFMSADSIVSGAGNPQALNRYSYVLNNPMKYVDPSGHAQACDDTTGGCGTPGTFCEDNPSDPACTPYTPPPDAHPEAARSSPEGGSDSASHSSRLYV